jgi:hypothetical protein
MRHITWITFFPTILLIVTLLFKTRFVVFVDTINVFQNGTNIQRYFEESNSFLETARKEESVVLVHCRGGTSFLTMAAHVQVSAVLHLSFWLILCGR